LETNNWFQSIFPALATAKYAIPDFVVRFKTSLRFQ